MMRSLLLESCVVCSCHVVISDIGLLKQKRKILFACPWAGFCCCSEIILYSHSAWKWKLSLRRFKASQNPVQWIYSLRISEIVPSVPKKLFDDNYELFWTRSVSLNWDCIRLHGNTLFVRIDSSTWDPFFMNDPGIIRSYCQPQMSFIVPITYVFGKQPISRFSIVFCMMICFFGFWKKNTFCKVEMK